MWEVFCSLYSIYHIWYIYKMSLDDSFTLSSEHSCRGLWGLVLDHISTHQLRNGVQIAALIPRLGPAGGSSALKQPISIRLSNKQALWSTSSWQRPHLCVSSIHSVHTDTSALCIFSGWSLHVLSMRTLNASKSFWVFLKLKLGAETERLMKQVRPQRRITSWASQEQI